MYHITSQPSMSGEVGAYDLKWKDLVNIDEIKVSSTPVKSTTTSV